MLMAVNEPYALMVQPDDILISPREVDEHFGTMVCFHPRYALGDHHNYMDKDDFLREMYLDTVGHDEAGMKRYERMVNIVSSRFRHGPKTEERAIDEAMEVYNDYNSNLTNLFFCVKERPLALITELGFLPLNSRDDFEVISRQLKCEEFDDEYLAIELELADKYFSPLHAKAIKALLLKHAQRGNVRRAANYYKLIRYSFSGAGKSFGGKPCNIRNFFTDIWRCSRRLENVVVENKDFESLLAQYDRPDAFFYCDPPYYNAECYEVEFPKRDHLRLCSAIKRCRGFAMVSYNFCFEILDIYKDFYIFRTKRPNSMSQTAGSEYEEVIITNFDPLLCTSQLSIFTRNSDMGVELVHEPELPCGLTEDGKIIFNKDTEESR